MSRQNGSFNRFQSSRDSDLNIDFELDDEDFDKDKLAYGEKRGGSLEFQDDTIDTGAEFEYNPIDSLFKSAPFHSSPTPDVSQLSHISQLSNHHRRDLHSRSKPLTVSFRDNHSSEDEEEKRSRNEGDLFDQASSLGNHRSSRFEGRGLSYNRHVSRPRSDFDNTRSASVDPLADADETKKRGEKGKKIDRRDSQNEPSATSIPLYPNNIKEDEQDGSHIREKTPGSMPREEREERQRRKSKAKEKKGKERKRDKSERLVEAITTNASGNPIQSMLFFAISNDDLKLVRVEV